eukprot:1155403-Prorocentrum_minimum.AAC.1
MLARRKVAPMKSPPAALAALPSVVMPPAPIDRKWPQPPLTESVRARRLAPSAAGDRKCPRTTPHALLAPAKHDGLTTLSAHVSPAGVTRWVRRW